MLKSYFETRSKFLDDALATYLDYGKEQPDKLYKALNYSVFSGGKRLRPVLFFATYEMLLGLQKFEQLQPLLPVAASVEMIHTASLIHDDLPAMDNSNERRGKESCHKKFTPAIAILTGDALLTKAFEMLTLYEDKEIAVELVNILCFAVSTRGMIGGQTVDVLSSKKAILPLNVLRYIHTKKTGALLEASVRMACACAKADQQITQTLSTFANNLGLAYQIIDDILDDIGDIDMLGKEAFEDVRNNRRTYPTIMGIDKARKLAEKLLEDSTKIVKNFDNNENLLEFIAMIKDRMD
jgi:geranylgeranyl diphosphate synthase type II